MSTRSWKRWMGLGILASALLGPGLRGESHAWENVATEGEPQARHEAAFIEFEGAFYLLGGRRIQPVNIYDPQRNSWRVGSPPPIEFHHFQPVVWEDRILMACAMTGKFPNEQPLERVLAYLPRSDTWEWMHEIPEGRRRGSAGAVAREGRVWLACGITRGHMGGYVNWFDEYDPASGSWRVLPEAPHARDHFQMAIVGDKLFCAGGRTTSHETKQLFDLEVAPVDVYDFSLQAWSVLEKPLPTPRAGNSTLAIRERLVVIGGESARQELAHQEVEAWDTVARVWETWPALSQGRHGTGAFVFENYIYTCSGCGQRGGKPELTSMERAKLK